MLEEVAARENRSLSHQAEYTISVFEVHEQKRTEIERLAEAETIKALRLAGRELLRDLGEGRSMVVIDCAALIAAAVPRREGPC